MLYRTFVSLFAILALGPILVVTRFMPSPRSNLVQCELLIRRGTDRRSLGRGPHPSRRRHWWLAEITEGNVYILD